MWHAIDMIDIDRAKVPDRHRFPAAVARRDINRAPLLTSREMPLSARSAVL
jgi:hypothetical protein